MMIKMHGVKLPNLKQTAGCAPERIPTPSKVTIPMSMHIGIPAVPVVKPGDTVKVGQLIGEAGGFVSAPVYASISGTVASVDNFMKFAGNYVKSITIASDGRNEPLETLTPPDVHDLESFLHAVNDSGVVGQGGAGFPSAVKLVVKDLDKIEAIIINGAECEPYVTSDTRTMLDRTDEVWEGILMLQEYYRAKRIIIAIEENKPECIQRFRALCENTQGIEVAALPHMYPQGGEKILVYNLLGHIIPEGKLPIDVGAVVINCTTLATITHYIRTGMPLVERCVTVDGSAVRNPGNVIAPIGTPLSVLYDFCGGFKEEPGKVLYCGAMMGMAVHSLDMPVQKTTNATLAFNRADARIPESTACIRCGNCINHCPLKLAPNEIETAYRLKDPEKLSKLKVNLCMECGCCSYICPAKRPLVQTNKLAKVLLRDWQKLQEQKAKEELELKEAEERKEAATNE